MISIFAEKDINEGKFVMPTDAFYQLDEEKRQHLLNAALCEFSEQPYEKVSVFKIAKNAGISRSSFYYYFKDKKDIYHHLLFEVKLKFIEELKTQEKKYDIFSLARAVFYEIASMKERNLEAFMYRVVDNMKFEDMLRIMEQIEQYFGASFNNVLTGLDSLRVQSDRQILGLAALLRTGILYALLRYIRGECSLEEAEARFDEILDMIQFGVRKEKGD